jgi:hypothetical protein
MEPDLLGRYGTGAAQLHDFSEQDDAGEMRTDMVGFQKAVTEMPADELNDAFSQIGDEVIQDLARDMTAGEGRTDGSNGLTADEREDVYRAMARKLEGPQLAQWLSALNEPAESEQQARLVTELTPAKRQVETLKALLPAATREPVAIGNDMLPPVNPQAAALVTILGSRRGASFDEAVASMNDGQLKAVFRLTLVRDAQTFRANQPERLGGVFDAALTSQDPKVQARVFAAGSAVLQDFIAPRSLVDRYATDRSSWNDAAKCVGDGLTRLLNSDTRGIVAELCGRGFRNQAAGAPLTTYMTYLFDRNPSAAAKIVSGQMLQLQGEGTGQDPIDYLNTPKDTSYGTGYPNARYAGTFAGSVVSALNRVDTTEKQLIDTVSSFFTGTLILGNGLLSPGKFEGVKGVAALTGGGVREGMRQANLANVAERREIRAEIDQAPRSESPQPPIRFDHTAAWRTFETAEQAVVRSND